MQKLTRTTTAVHDEVTRSAVASRSERRENALALCTLLYAVMLSMSALQLLNISAGASFISLLAALLPAALLYALSARCAGRLQGRPHRAAAGVFALFFFLDMALCLLSLCEVVCAYVLPQASRTGIALLTAVGTGLSLRRREHCAARTAAFLCGFFLPALLICLCIALPETDAGYLFPLLSYGAGQTLRGGAYIAGGLWSAAAIPFFVYGENPPELKKSRLPLLPLMTVLLMALLCFFYALLLPAPLLPGNWGFVLRLQLLMEMSPNTLCWSLMLISRMLLFLTACAVAGEHTERCLHRALHKHPPAPVILFLFAALVATRPLHQLQPVLAVALPLRFPLAFLITLGTLIRTRKEAQHG